MPEQCLLWETCQAYSNGTKRRPHHIRLTSPCIHWNGEYCTDKIAGVKPGDACKITKGSKK